MARIYGQRFDGKVFEIQNWAHSKSGDALIMHPLSNTQTRKLVNLRARGCSDSQIWRHLHPDQTRTQRGRQQSSKPGQFDLEIEAMAKSQLVWLIENMMSASVESLTHMTRKDLIKLAIHLGGGKRLRIVFTA